MATTTRTDVAELVPELLIEAVKGQFAGKKALFGSPAVSADYTLLNVRGGDTITMPYFATIGEFEDTNEGVALTPAVLDTSETTATVQHSGKAFEISQWARICANHADPYAEAARQIVEGAFRRMDAKLIEVAKASLVGVSMVKDISAAVAPACYPDYDAFVDARMLFGDEADDVALCVMHSATATRLMKWKDNNGMPILTMPSEGKLGSVVGMPLFVSDRLTADATVYTTLLLKRGALGLWATGTPSIKIDEDILADTNVAACHIYYAAARYTRLPGSSKGGVAHLKHK